MTKWPSITELESLFACSENGLVWRSAGGIAGHDHKEGDPVGSLTKRGYVTVGFTCAGRFYRMHVHRLVWALTTKVKPPDTHDVHHADRRRANNAFSNLKLELRAEHAKLHVSDKSPAQLARTIPRSDSTTGLLGVHKTKAGCWRMQLKTSDYKYAETFYDVLVAVDLYWYLKINICPGDKASFRRAHKEQRALALQLKGIPHV